MPELVGYLLLFVAIGVFFVFIHLCIGRLLRPIKPDPEKLTIYECGEPTIGSAWIQFDLRFYVVALLFVIFDVEVAFFFPWAVVFGKANDFARSDRPPAQRVAQAEEKGLFFVPTKTEGQDQEAQVRKMAAQLSWLAFWDILIFFGVLLVGYAYLWKRGDLDWVRSLAAERAPEAPPVQAAIGKETRTLVGSASTKY